MKKKAVRACLRVARRTGNVVGEDTMLLGCFGGFCGRRGRLVLSWLAVMVRRYEMESRELFCFTGKSCCVCSAHVGGDWFGLFFGLHWCVIFSPPPRLALPLRKTNEPIGRPWPLHPEGDPGRDRHRHGYVRGVCVDVRDHPLERGADRRQARGVEGGLADALPCLRR